MIPPKCTRCHQEIAGGAEVKVVGESEAGYLFAHISCPNQEARVERLYEARRTVGKRFSTAGVRPLDPWNDESPRVRQFWRAILAEFDRGGS